ncbi:uncharacterized protein B0H18DRAFT_1023024 [Fomitopsis serialis]|uniref:uncharacterized protein n=1 Tax=Fomitopsis serialis TaxID=139415 RepID=UPI00200783CC|nr:uncharacterized protein B0H18DRAFT_1023024 [Neoantrodia serialis]KAH9920967.1 hypothetical protein B0H18DRAFT_1023024 [Neoantrodia serialis]
MKSVAVFPILAVSALASSALIPTGISSSCSSFFESFDQDTSLASCVSPLIQATSQFGAGANSTANPTSSAVSSALSSLCSATTCSSQTIREKLSNMYSSCAAELTAANKDVLRTYDVLYSIVPLQQAMCSKNSNGDYCVLAASSGNSSSSSGSNDAASSATGEKFSSISEYLYSDASPSVARRDSSQTTISILCTDCARNVMTAYIDFEGSVPYAPGIAASTLMSGQTALYKGIISTCGSSFMGGAAQAAGAISSGEFSGAPSTIAVNTKMVSAVFGVAVIAFFTML